MPMEFSKRLYHTNYAQWEESLRKNWRSDRDLEVKTIEKGIILPARWSGRQYEGGVCDQDCKFVTGFVRGNGQIGFGGMRQAYAVEREKIQYVDEDVIYGGATVSHFGHFMSECMNRMWYALEHPELKLKVAIILSLGGWRAFHDEFYKLMGIARDRIIYVNQPMQFKSVIVPEQSLFSFESYTKEYPIVYRHLVKNIPSGDVKKLYLTRTAFDSENKGGFHCFGENYFEDYFTRKGFTVVAPEKLPVKDQISLVKGADEIASTLGSLSHFAMFCEPGKKFIMLERHSEGVNPLQCVINQASGVDWYVVDASKNYLYCPRTTGTGLFGSTECWTQFVRDYFNDNITEDDDAAYFNAALDGYIKFWCEKYNQTPHLKNSIKNLCMRIVSMERQSRVDHPLLCYETHVATEGWLARETENHISGFLDQQLRIEAIKIYFSEPHCDVFYSVYFNESEGWSEEVSNGQVAGTTGRSKPIKGIRIRLDGEGASMYDVLYRVHDFNGHWSPWVRNGEALITNNALLNAIQIKLTPPRSCKIHVLGSAAEAQSEAA